jgi:hypothetical protein
MRLTALLLSASAIGSAGCNAILGIDDHTLATGGSDAALDSGKDATQAVDTGPGDGTSTDTTPVDAAGGGADAPAEACTNDCTLNLTQCAVNVPQTCELQPNGCTQWVSTATCSHKTCVSGACAGVCGPGDTQCSGDGTAVQSCDPNGQWTTQKDCHPNICRHAACSTTCPIASPNPDVLPFVVDSRFIASGYFGDRAGVTMKGYGTGADACTPAGVGRSSPSAKGNCWAISFAEPDGGLGYAGVIWLWPDQNFGTSPGYAIPLGATQVSFWARGAVGGEMVDFGAGSKDTNACSDAFVLDLPVTLTNTWKQYTLPLDGQVYGGGVVYAFDWAVTANASFYVDDIEWQ